jgi:hypothetical protein
LLNPLAREQNAYMKGQLICIEITGLVQLMVYAATADADADANLL